MVPDESSTSRWNRLCRTAAGRFSALLGVSSRPRSNGRRRFVPVAVVLALAVGLAVVPAIGIATGIGPAAESGSVAVGACDGLDSGASSEHGATSTALRATIPVDTGGPTAYEHAVDRQPLADQDPVSAIVAVAESLSGESIVLLGAYSRYGDGSPLEHPIRSEIDELTSQRPGVQFAAVVDAVDASESTVRYHTRILEHEDLVQTATVWGTQRLFPGETDPGHFEALAAVRDDTRSAVLRAIDDDEPPTVSTIADRVDRAPSTVSHHLSGLESANLIDRDRAGQSVHVTLAPGVHDLLDAEANADADGVEQTALELVGD